MQLSSAGGGNMFRWIRRNWLVTAIIGLVTYCIHIVVEYLIVDSVLKYAGITLSIV